MRAGGSFEPACASLVRGGQRQERGFRGWPVPAIALLLLRIALHCGGLRQTRSRELCVWQDSPCDQ